MQVIMGVFWVIFMTGKIGRRAVFVDSRLLSASCELRFKMWDPSFVWAFLFKLSQNILAHK